MTIGPAPMIRIDSMSVRLGMARPCALRGPGRQPARRENGGSTPCPPVEGGWIARPRPRAVLPRRVRCTKPWRGAGWGTRRALSSGRAENDGCTPCPAVGVLLPLEDSPRRRRDAEEAERVAAVVLAGDVRALSAGRFERLGGRSPC